MTIRRYPLDLHGCRWLATFGLLAAVFGAPAAHAYAEVPTRAVAACEDAERTVDLAYAHWIRLLDGRDALSEGDFIGQAEAVVANVFSLSRMSSRILGSRWQGLDASRRLEFQRALTRSIRSSLVSYFEASAPLPALRPAAEDMTVEDGIAQARFWLVAPDESQWFTFRFAADDDNGGPCGIIDIRMGDRSLVSDIRGRVTRLLDDYSFPNMIAELGGYDAVILADFESDTVGELPQGWTWRDSDKDKNKPYRVRSERGNQYLEATDEGESVILGQEIRWDLEAFPYISFRVRINQIPEGGDERDDNKVDSAAGLYITYRKKFFGKIPESAKYVWSSTLPVGAAVKREGIGRPWQIVFGSGEEGLGEWRTYVFDLRQAYTDTFGGSAPSKSVGVGILSDANSLKLKAYADYDDIRALREAPPGVTSGVTDILEPIGNE